MEKARKKIKLCSTCHGEGGTWNYTQRPIHGSDQGKREYTPCPTCKGSGRVEVRKDITIHPFIPNNYVQNKENRQSTLPVSDEP
jgi:DnaJ-class molecular chaperone